ncbi:Peroxisomal membrane anchor protein (Pex14) [Rasamsonia emersonii CBS 393.64]|uniref:Peroxisomal membrane protein PEX14 n=1 Tax=Rasamsonia emersonii (strain ATCC 16479 / CBS 393.64 / IMI 116815) TaxID=1408163 RepID=A0A0F4YS32_RASE3|nr:Peroxisomal membrane anchor protein (Pex14) [Rasamsonia emersonii CBS 393.64]KKA21059.1 Peroxisomal membrane anchor protein (Pex14) [Rasamsonia emersonii CBS 393.64]
MAREELVSSAVTFLQDPSVSSAPLEKRIAFLQSKNLTQEEIDLALARAGEETASSSPTNTPPSGHTAQQPPAYRQTAPPPAPGYGYPPYGQWQPPPELPRRDWRDWFIMATVTGVIIQRYIVPLIAPPTPPQLEQDKKSIDEQFARAFALIDQLSTDTAALKSAEEARTERLDAALREVENVVSELKTSVRRRDEDTRRISEEVRNLKDSIPKALEGAREGNENRLKELGTELKSLKVLLGNRLNAGGAAGSSLPGRTVGSMTLSGASRPSDEASGSSATTNGIPAASQSQPSTVSSGEAAAQPATNQTPSNETTSNPVSHLPRPASIPAWQMAAANRSKAASQQSTASSNSEQQNGASS